MPLAPGCLRRAPGGRTAGQRPTPGGLGPRTAPGNRLGSLSRRPGCTRTSLLIMATTRLFRNGNSQAVRIPAKLAYERSDLELEIERCGDELRIRPAGRPITGALQALASFSPSFLAAGRDQDEQQVRESL